MAKSKKFDVRLIEEGATWTAQITRRKTARETIVSKSQDGFASESEAQAWGDEQLADFVKNAAEKNKRR